MSSTLCRNSNVSTLVMLIRRPVGWTHAVLTRKNPTRTFLLAGRKRKPTKESNIISSTSQIPYTNMIIFSHNTETTTFDHPIIKQRRATPKLGSELNKMVPSEARTRLIDFSIILLLSVIIAAAAYQYQTNPGWFQQQIVVLEKTIKKLIK
jgi:hypothetical protein